jgi:hypothetical protein
MFGPLPARNLTDRQINRHPINVHPPAVIDTLNTILNIKTSPELDFSERRRVHTVWASATFGVDLRRFVYARGWTQSKRSGVVDLNFTAAASERQKGIIESLDAIAEQTGATANEPAVAPPPVHHALVVRSTGAMYPLVLDAIPDKGEGMNLSTRGEKDHLVNMTLIEAIAYLHSTSPPPPGMHSIVLPPASGSLKALSKELDLLGVPVLPLVPEALPNLNDPLMNLDDALLVAPRAALTGLHIPSLHTIYLLNGVDMSGLTPSQYRYSGRHGRETQYGIIAGRLGRVSTFRQGRVISLVSEGSYEHQVLGELFLGRLNTENLKPFALTPYEGRL